MGSLKGSVGTGVVDAAAFVDGGKEAEGAAALVVGAKLVGNVGEVGVNVGAAAFVVGAKLIGDIGEEGIGNCGAPKVGVPKLGSLVALPPNAIPYGSG